MTTTPRTDALLIVEDNPDDLHFVLRAFRRLGSTLPLRIARTGQEALDYLEGPARGSDHLLAVLLDLKIPIRSGFDVLAHIKGDADLRSTPVVVLTSSEQSADLRRAYELGANSYLVKPAQSGALGALMASFEDYWVKRNRLV